MIAFEEIRDVFSILHDGEISAWSGDHTQLILTIDCQYLAERINKSFQKFYVELLQVDDLSLTTWLNPLDSPVQKLIELSDIFKAKLQLLSAEIKEEKVVIECNQHDLKFNYCGGYLTIACHAIKVFDQDKNELTIDQLDGLCKSYWADMSREIEKSLMAKRLPE
jgi:hypothetical protein